MWRRSRGEKSLILRRRTHRLHPAAEIAKTDLLEHPKLPGNPIKLKDDDLKLYVFLIYHCVWRDHLQRTPVAAVKEFPGKHATVKSINPSLNRLSSRLLLGTSASCWGSAPSTRATTTATRIHKHAARTNPHWRAPRGLRGIDFSGSLMR
jgi:hypothetical protein